MKYLNLLLVLLFLSSCEAQETKLLVTQSLISDWEKYPFYPRLVEDINEKNIWKSKYKYLDNIEVYSITYMSDGLRVEGLMAKPKEEGNYPCIIYNRGGNRDFGSLKVAHGAMKLGKIAKEGYVVIASQYRGNAGGQGQEEFGGADVNDVTILPEVLKEVEGADTKRIGMYGWSRGGMMTYLALTKTNKIKVAATGGAPTDLVNRDREGMEKVYAELIPGYQDGRDKVLTERSALFWVDKFPKNVPILLMHGNADWRVKSTQTLQLALEFEKHRIPYRLKIFEGADHGISEFTEEVDQEVIGWFNRYLKGVSALPDMEFHGR